MGSSMRIVTLNTWKCDGAYRMRLPLMAQGLAALAPDLVLLQEVFASDDGFYDTAAVLAQALSMVAAHAPARHKTRQFEGRPHPGTSGMAVLSRQPALEHLVLPLPADATDGERVAQLLHYAVGPDGLWVLNVHLSHLPGASALRANQLQTCLAELRRHTAGAACLIAGDFNTTPASAEFRQLLDAPENFFNPFAGQRKTTHRNEAGEDLDLDHILLSRIGPNRVNAAAVALDPRNVPCPLRASDHAAVVMDLDLTP